MNLKTQKQDLEKLLIYKIEEYCKEKILYQEHKQSTLKHMFKMIVTDPQLQDFFKCLIKIEVGKLKQQNQKKYSPQQETKIIKENIKSYIEQLIKKQFQKKQSISNRCDKPSVNEQATVNKSDQSEKVIITQEKIQEQNKVQNSTTEKSKSENQIKNTYTPVHKKRKMIKKQTLKSTVERTNKSEGIIQIASQTEDHQTQKKITKKQAKPCDPGEKQAILKKYLSFLPSKREQGLCELRKTSQMGHFIYGDNVKNVIDIYYSGESNKNIVLLMDWHQRRDGFKPQSSMVSLQEYQYYKPLQVRLLLKKIQTSL